jgi:uncharacterized protein with von Willebrand factor type A (vWA) domain
MNFERRLAAAEALQAAITAAQADQAEDNRTAAEIIDAWIQRGWIQRGADGQWEARDDDGRPIGLGTLEGRRRTCFAALVNLSEQRGRNEL